MISAERMEGMQGGRKKECLPVNFLRNYPINNLDTYSNVEIAERA